MARKNEIVEKETIEEVAAPVSDNPKIMIDDFLDEQTETKGMHNLYAGGFRVHWKMNLNQSLLERKTFAEWDEEFKKYKEYKTK